MLTALEVGWSSSMRVVLYRFSSCLLKGGAPCIFPSDLDSSFWCDIRTSEWSNDRSLKRFRTLQSFSLCSSVKSSGCRTSRNTWGPGAESLSQVSTCSLSLYSDMLGCSRSGVLIRTISFSFTRPLTLRQPSGSSSVLNTVVPSMKFPTELLWDQLFPSRTTLSSDTGEKT